MEKNRFIEIVNHLEDQLINEQHCFGLCVCLNILESYEYISSYEYRFFLDIFNKEIQSEIEYDYQGNEKDDGHYIEIQYSIFAYRFPNDQSRIDFLNMLRDDADYYI